MRHDSERAQPVEAAVADIARLIGADGLIYQELTDVYQAINDAAQSLDKKIKRFEDSIFTGDYIAGKITAQYLLELSQMRNDENKEKKRKKRNEFIKNFIDDLT